MESRRRPGYLIALVLTVDAAALAHLFVLPGAEMNDRWALFGLLLGLAAITGVRSVRLPELKIHLTAIHPFLLVALAALGPRAAILVGTLGVVTSSVANRGQRTPLRLAFNLGSMALAISAAAWAFALSGGSLLQPAEAIVAPLAAGTLAFLAVHSVLLSLVVVLDTGRKLTTVLRGVFASTLGSSLMGFTLAMAILAVREALILWPLILASATCWVLGRFHAVYAQERG